jgi:YVTN family beta-propeller protein
MRLAPLALLGLVVSPFLTAQAFVHYESAQARPIAVSADGLRLYAANTADSSLAVLSLADPSVPVLLREIRVGLEPVAVAPRTADEVWVVDAVSDSISVVDVARGVVTATIAVKDEPADIVFAGGKAFVSVTTDREVRVFDPLTRGELARIAIFGDEPRHLLASADGGTVWVAVHLSGNKTTIVPEPLAPPPPPPTNLQLPPPPRTGLIVDSDDPTWKPILNVDLPDHDVVEIDVATLKVRRTYSGVGTNLFGMALRPGTSELWVANTHARNLVRFEPAVRGHAIDSRLTRIVTGTPALAAIDLNPGIDYSVLPNDPATAIALSQPTAIEWNARGERGYVAAFGTDRIGVIDAAGSVVARIEVGNVSGATADPRNKRGPRGLALHPHAPRLYVLNRLADSISVIDTIADKVLGELELFDPTPTGLKEGRGFLYDAKLSGNGTMACAACHIDGRTDGLAWDLGDRGGNMEPAVGKGGIGNFMVHPMKGPMLTQTLQGLGGVGPFHWRGDRATLQDFNGAFASLMGRTQLARPDIDAFAAFMESIAFPSNPNQNLDRTYPTTPPGLSADEGFRFYTQIPFNGVTRCVDCHSLTTGTNSAIFSSQALGVPQPFKVAQLRLSYKKTGFKKAPQRTSGFGVLHDGSDASVFDLLSRTVFGPLATNTVRKTQLQNFVEAFDSGTAPTVGFAVTVSRASIVGHVADLLLLESQAMAGNCALIAKGRLDGVATGLAFDRAARTFRADRSGMGPFTLADLAILVANDRAALTFAGVPLGTAQRLGIDRDLDGTTDGDEGLDPYGASSPGCGGALALAGNATPDVGNAQFALVCENAPAATNGFVVLGLARTSVPVLGITLLVDPTLGAVVPMSGDARGAAFTRLPIPADAALRGGAFHAQAIFPSSCGSEGLVASQGLTVTVGR